MKHILINSYSSLSFKKQPWLFGSLHSIVRSKRDNQNNASKRGLRNGTSTTTCKNAGSNYLISVVVLHSLPAFLIFFISAKKRFTDWKKAKRRERKLGASGERERTELLLNS